MLIHDIPVMPLGDDRSAEDDEAAIIRTARDDPDAFAAIYHRYADRVYAYVRARTGDAEEAADVTQQVFLQALNALPRYQVRQAPFAAWLFRIARNTVIDSQRRRRDTIAWDFVPELLHPIDAQDVEAQALRREAIARVRLLLQSLDTDTRDVLVLRFAGRLTAAQIAVVIGKSEAATKKKLSRALQTLKEQYHDQTR